MKFKSVKAAMLMSAALFAANIAQAEPAKKVDYSQVLVPANKAIEAGKHGKSDLLIQYAEEALKHAKEISKERVTPLSQRVTEDLSAAVKKAKAGDIEEAIKFIEATVPAMK